METTQIVQPATAPATPIRLCVVDLGTNSFHAVIVDVNPNGTFTILDKIKEMVKLGEGGFSSHLLSDAAMQRGVEALHRIRILAEGWGAEEYMAFGTSAIREADNGGVFIQKVREELDLNIRAISGDMETRLIYEGVRRAVELAEPTLLVDIGGGSTEFVVGNSTESFFLRSLKLGAARITERFVTTDPINKVELKTLRKFYRDKLKPVVAASLEHDVRDLVGSSGTIENIAQVYLNEIGESSRSIYQYEFDAKSLRRVTKALTRSTLPERKSLPGIDEKRVDQVVAGAVLVDVLLKDLNIRRVRVSPNALREGIVVHFIAQNYARLERLAPYAGVRRRSVFELAYKCQWEETHALKVAELALQLFDACRELHGLRDPERELLEYAALLHDIGYHISRSSHHKHSRYLIENADLKGFQPEEIEIMAFAARYHRKAHPKKSHTDFQALPDDRRNLILKLAALLRLAEGLDRSHFQNVERLDVSVRKGKLSLKLHTDGDPQLDVWGAMRDADLFESVYGLKVVVEVVEPQDSDD